MIQCRPSTETGERQTVSPKPVIGYVREAMKGVVEYQQPESDVVKTVMNHCDSRWMKTRDGWRPSPEFMREMFVRAAKGMYWVEMARVEPFEKTRRVECFAAVASSAEEAERIVRSEERMAEGGTVVVEKISDTVHVRSMRR